MGQGALWQKDVTQNERSDEQDYEGRLEEPFFKYVKRSKDYDQNEVPWPEKRGGEPVQVQISELELVPRLVYLATELHFDHNLLIV